MIDGLSAGSERRVLIDPSTRKMVLDILRLAETRDPVDAARDSELAARILSGRVKRLLMRTETEKARQEGQAAHIIGARAEKAWKAHDAETQRKLRGKPATGEELKRLAEGGE